MMFANKVLFRIRVRLNSNLVTPTLVKELREKSGAGMMDCKKALADATVNGDINKAMDWLRSKGIARATSQVCICMICFKIFDLKVYRPLELQVKVL